MIKKKTMGIKSIFLLASASILTSSIISGCGTAKTDNISETTAMVSSVELKTEGTMESFESQSTEVVIEATEDIMIDYEPDEDVDVEPEGETAGKEDDTEEDEKESTEIKEEPEQTTTKEETPKEQQTETPKETEKVEEVRYTVGDDGMARPVTADDYSTTPADGKIDPSTGYIWRALPDGTFCFQETWTIDQHLDWQTGMTRQQRYERELEAWKSDPLASEIEMMRLGFSTYEELADYWAYTYYFEYGGWDAIPEGDE